MKSVPDAAGPPLFGQYGAMVGVMAAHHATQVALKNGMDGEYFSQRKTKLER